MAKFKPMPKEKTTEPSVELKLAKGGEVETPAMHKAEMAAIEKVDTKLTKHAKAPASKAHAGLKTGGVVKGKPAGFAVGGMAKDVPMAKKVPMAIDRRSSSAMSARPVAPGGALPASPSRSMTPTRARVAGGVPAVTPSRPVATPAASVPTPRGMQGLMKDGGPVAKYKDGGAVKKTVEHGMVQYHSKGGPAEYKHGGHMAFCGGGSVEGFGKMSGDFKMKAHGGRVHGGKVKCK